MEDQPADKREVILRAAARVIGRVGYYKASIKAIAKEAGLSAPSLLYHYFENKRALALELASRMAQESLIPPGEHESVYDYVYRLIDIRLKWVSEHRDLYQVFLATLWTDEEMRRLLLQQVIAPLHANLEHKIEQLIESGELPPQDARLSAQILGAAVAMLMGMLVSDALPLGEGDEHAATIGAITDFFMYGLAGQPEAAR
jgi:AcrR family transcriptional regulator